jgi:hypothetical protein
VQVLAHLRRAGAELQVDLRLGVGFENLRRARRFEGQVLEINAADVELRLRRLCGVGRLGHWKVLVGG